MKCQRYLVILVGWGCMLTGNGESGAFAQPGSGFMPWHFPGPPERRFPIVANNFMNNFHAGWPEGNRRKELDTLVHFFSLAQRANFTLARVFLTGSAPLSATDSYGPLVFAALRTVNDREKSRALRLIVTDGRASQPFTPAGLDALANLYSRPELYAFSVDEPRPDAFGRLAQWAHAFNIADTSSWLFHTLYYVNLFGVSALDGYEDYVHSWIDTGRPRVLSYDNYAVWDDSLASEYGYAIGSDWDRNYFYNLELFRQASLETSVPFWTWILVHRHYSVYSKRFYRQATPEDLRYEVYSALAYGAKGILYYNFWNPHPDENKNGWHEQDAILGYDGQPGPLFTVASQINGEILTMGDLLLDLRSVGVYHATNDFPHVDQQRFRPLEPLASKGGKAGGDRYGVKLVSWNADSLLSPEELNEKFVVSLDNSATLIGLFRHSKTHERYALVVNKDRRRQQVVRVGLDPTKFFRQGVSLRVTDVHSGITIPLQRPAAAVLAFTLTMAPGDGVLLRLRER